MSIISTFLLMMVVTAIFLVNALRNNFQSGQEVRKQIARRIEQLPFGKMLKRHKVDTIKFLYQIPLTEVESEIRVCQSCIKTVECNKALQSENSDLGFCPNLQTILQQKTVC
jgi:hypothetical protein